MENIKDVIRKNLIRLIDSSSLSQKKIASSVGVSEPTIYRWKSGENSPEMGNIERLAGVLKVDQWEFFRTDEIRFGPEPVSAVIKKMISVPDDVYELALKVGDPKDPQWENVRSALELAIERKEREKKSKKAH